MNQYGTWARRTQWILQAGWPVADTLVYPVECSHGHGHSNMPNEHQPTWAMNSVDAASEYIFGRIWESDSNPYQVNNLCILTDIRTPTEAWKIDQMLRKGASLTYCGTEPSQWSLFEEHRGRVVNRLSESLDKAQQQGRISDGRKDGWEKVLRNTSSVKWNPQNAPLTYLHRRIEGAELYFIMNCGGPFDGEIEFSEQGLTPQIWNADIGKTSQCAQWQVVDGKTKVKLHLGRLESTVIVFTQDQPQLHVTQSQGAEIIRDTSGQLHALISAGKKCTVHLSNGDVTKIDALAPRKTRLDNGWTLSANPDDGVGLKVKTQVKLDKLKSWRELGDFQRYSGKASYRTEFDAGRDFVNEGMMVELDLGKVYEVAEVRLNGKRIGVSWYPPYRVDITSRLKKGKNKLRIDVANVLKNHLTEGENSHPSGLLGPVTIKVTPKAQLGK
jgi:hypothetical protein